MPGTHSKIVGGSTAARVLACPGSVQRLWALPIAEVPSAYAAEGTALHSAMELLLQEGLDPVDIVGRRFKGDDREFVIYEEMAQALQVCIDHVESLPEGAIYLEQSGPFPGIEGAFGTTDFFLVPDEPREPLELRDWKFGSGVGVKAIYDLPDGKQKLNPQLMYYACVLRQLHPAAFKGRIGIRLGIVQPRVEEPVSLSPVVPFSKLDQFERELAAAVKQALGENAPVQDGPHCRFAACKVTCPLHTGPLLDLAMLKAAGTLPTKEAAAQLGSDSLLPSSGSNMSYSDLLGYGLDMIALVEDVIGEIKAQAHLHLERGGKISGYKLVPKRPMRKWINEEKAPDALRALGLPLSKCFTEDVVSPAEAERRLKEVTGKKPKLEITDDKGAVVPLTHSISSGTTIARDDDPRGEAETLDSVVAAFSAAVAGKLS